MKISVVIPLYNKESTIERALNSVLAQSRPADQILVINDGSTDLSGELAQAFTDKNVHLIHQKNKGVSEARNRGIHAANGDYIAFLDADDYWLPDHLELLQSLFNSHPDSVLLSTRSVGSILTITESALLPPTLQPVQSGNLLLLFADDHAIINSSTACIKRCALLEVSGFPEGISRGEDIITWLRLGEVGDFSGSTTASVVYDRNVHGSASSMPLIEAPESLTYIASQSRRRDLTSKTKSAYRRLYRRISLSTAAVSRSRGNSSDLRILLHHAIRQHLWFTAIGLVSVRLTPQWLLVWMRKQRLKRAAFP